jgi:tetratricopeptide (TPR) repeat protein
VVVAVLAFGRWDQTPIGALAEASAQLRLRPFDGRLSGGFRHRPVAPPRDGAASDLHIHAVAAEVIRNQSDAHASGVALLLLRRYDSAIERLEEAARSSPRDATVLSDLSAAYYARAVVRQFPPDLASALDTAEHAWSLERSPESAWNRAVAIAAFHVTGATARAWNDALSLQRDEDWRHEAQQRLADTRRVSTRGNWTDIEPLLRQWSTSEPSAIAKEVAKSPAEALAYFEDGVVTHWARTRLDGDEDSTRQQHAIASLLANALAQDGDRFATDTLAAIDHACRSDTSCNVIARAHKQFADAKELIEQQRYLDAAEVINEVRPVFERMQSPYAFSSRFQRAVCAIHENALAVARSSGVVLLSAIKGKQYGNLQAHTLWLLGLSALNAGRPEESIDHYTAARERFTKTRDLKNTAHMDLLLADAFEFAGDRDVAMKHRLAALEEMARSGDKSQLFLALFEAGSSIAARSLPYAADFLLSESVREAEAHERHTIAAMASMWRSKIAAQRRDFDVAGEQARLAQEYWSRIQDPGQRALIAVNVTDQKGVAERRRDPVEQLTETIRFFAGAGNRSWLPQLLRQRALLQERRGDRAAAEIDFRQAIDMSEEVLDGEAPDTMLEGFAIDARAAYADMIRLLMERGASREALSYAERARLIGDGPHATRDVLAVIEKIPPSTAAVVFELQPGGVVTWLVSRHTVVSFPSSLKSLATVRRLCASSDPPDQQTRAALYDVLIRSWIANVSPGTEIAIAAPPELASVPFAALLDRDTNCVLIDRYPVTLIPNLASLRNEVVRVSPSDSVLVVGDPAYGESERLPRSLDESLAVARHYDRATVLTGARATAANVLSQMAGTSVFHFGGHAVLNELSPEMSSIVLAAEHGQDTRIYVQELLQRRLPMKLVVLSACSTAATHSRMARGTLTVARAFLKGGARTVVGTYWPVSDTAAARFSTTLHDALLRGDDVAHAVREAQLRLKSSSPVEEWAAFCVLQATGTRREGGGPSS